MSDLSVYLYEYQPPLPDVCKIRVGNLELFILNK